VPSAPIQAVDLHAHFGRWPSNQVHPCVQQFVSVGPDVVLRRARQAGTRLTAVSPAAALCTRDPADVLAENRNTWSAVQAHEGLLGWIVVQPGYAKTYEQAEAMLEHPKCIGIKIHPDQHGYDIREHGEEIFDFADRHQALVLTHSGDECSMPAHFVPFADRFPRTQACGPDM